MKNFNKSVMSVAVASALSLTALAPAVSAGELSASAGVATSYLWRGVDLGDGAPAVSASLDFAEGGFYAGMWVSSGDTSAGTEYDLYAGFAGEAGSLTYDVGIISYVYPTGGIQTDARATEGNIGDAMEAYISLGMGPVSLTHYENIAEGGGYIPNPDYYYTTVAVEAGAFSFLYGDHESAFSDHFDISYAFNDSISFTYTFPLEDDITDDEPVLVASYSFAF